MTEKLKALILDYVKSKGGGVSFAELGRDVPGFADGGELALTSGSDHNIILWVGLTQEACAAVTALMVEKKLDANPASVLSYLVDGGTLNLPIVKTTRKYKTPHWLPVTFNLGV